MPTQFNAEQPDLTW